MVGWWDGQAVCFRKGKERPSPQELAAASWKDGPGEADRAFWSQGSCAAQVESWPALDFLPGLEFWVLTLLSAASHSVAASPRLWGCDPCSGPGRFPFLPPRFRMLRSSHFQMPVCSLLTSPSLSSPFLQCWADPQAV